VPDQILCLRSFIPCLFTKSQGLHSAPKALSKYLKINGGRKVKRDEGRERERS
jgi:hypothetical protein